MKNPLPVLILAAALGFPSLALCEDEPPELPEHVSSLDLHATNNRLGKDGAGRILTFEVPYQRLTVWGRDGRREKGCSVLPKQLSGNVGAVGLYEDKAIVALHGDPEVLAIIDLAHCEVKSRTEVSGMIPLEFFAASGGWTATGPKSKEKGYSMIRLDLAGKTTESYSLPVEVQADITTRFPDLPAGRSIALSIAKDVWLIPASAYMFARPAQRGRDEYFFEPPACLAAEARELSGEEQMRFAEKRVQTSMDPQTRKETERVAKGIREGKGRTFLGAIATAASFGDHVALLVRYSRAGHSGCRLDVWDITTESPVAILPIGTECSNFLAFSDDTAWIMKAGAISEVALPPLTVPLKQPCAVFGGIARGILDESRSAEPPSREKPREKVN